MSDELAALTLWSCVEAPIKIRSDRCENFLYEIKAARLRRAARAARPRAGPRPAAGAYTFGPAPAVAARRAARRHNTTSPGAADEQAAPRLMVTSTCVLAGRAGSGMIVRHPDAYQRRTRNLLPRQGLATLDLRQTLAGVGEPEYGRSLGDGMSRKVESDPVRD